MANNEHLKILKQGVEVWNRWREEHPGGEIDLSQTTLKEAELSFVDLRRAFLRCCNLSKAMLCNANLFQASLNRADLSRANLAGAKLQEAILRRTNLSLANLQNADITGAKLYGTARDDWVIDGIICRYVFWDFDGLIRTPKDRNFRPGEFEELYRSLPTIEYYFEHGFTPVDAVLMDKVVQAVNEQHPDFELRLDSFHSRGRPHAVFTVLHREQADTALQQIRQDYEARIQQLQGKEAALLHVIDILSSRPQNIELVLGDKRMITTGRDYHEQTDGNTFVSD